MAYIGNSPERPTASGILDSIKTVDGTASGLDADTLDGKQLATIESEYQAFANTAAANVVDSAPGTLDTLNELAAALGDDANFSTTVTNSIATKMPLAGGTFTGAITAPSMVLNGDLRLDRGASDAAAVVFGPDYDVQIFGDGTAQTLTFMTGNTQRFHVSNTGIDVTGTAEVDTLKFSDNTTQTSAGASTGKAIAMAIVFGG